VTPLTPSPVKKVRLRTPNTDNKILREINALSRLSHRFVVRYYTAWFEDSELASATVSSDDSGDETADGATSVLRRDGSSDPFGIDFDDLGSESRSSTSFPSIHFTGSGSGGSEGSDGDIDGDETEADELEEMFEAPRNGSAVINVVPRTPPAPRPRTLYIQMVSFFTSTRIRP
jgi:translation initiation factor 2-alpha kinase 4